MDISIRLAVTIDLCCDCVRNAAYYDAGWISPNHLQKRESDFWVNLNGNFLDIAVLSWCYLFGDPKAEFRWGKLVADEVHFSSRMYEYLKFSELEFREYILKMRLYRDKRIAHRDRYMSEDPKIRYPNLDVAVNSTTFLFAQLLRQYPEAKEQTVHENLYSFYENRLELGRREYKTAIGNKV